MWQEGKKESKGKVCGMRVVISSCQRFLSPAFVLPPFCFPSASLLPPLCLASGIA